MLTPPQETRNAGPRGWNSVGAASSTLLMFKGGLVEVEGFSDAAMGHEVRAGHHEPGYKNARASLCGERRATVASVAARAAQRGTPRHDRCHSGWWSIAGRGRQGV